MTFKLNIYLKYSTKNIASPEKFLVFASPKSLYEYVVQQI